MASGRLMRQAKPERESIMHESMSIIPAPASASGGWWTPDAESSEYVVKMARAYVECALFVGLDWPEDGESEPTQLDDEYGIEDVSPEAWKYAEEQCRAFVESAGDLLDEWEPEQAGHDFEYTRNGHGTGFWDRGHEAGDELSELARPYGEDSLFAQDGVLNFES